MTRSVASQQDGEGGRKGSKGWAGRIGKEYGLQRLLGPMRLWRWFYRCLSFGVCVFGYHRSTGSCLPHFPLVLLHSHLGFLVWYMGNFHRGGGEREKGEMLSPSMGLCGMGGTVRRLQGALCCGRWAANHKRIMIIFFAYLNFGQSRGQEDGQSYLVRLETESQKECFMNPPSLLILVSFDLGELKSS